MTEEVESGESFAEFLKMKIQTTNDDWHGFCTDLRSNLCERCLTTRFGEAMNAALADNVKIMPWGKSRPRLKRGFFGYQPRPDDLQLQYREQRILLECKLLKHKEKYDLRNAFSQLMEYLLTDSWKEGYVVIFDTRKNLDRAKGALFSTAETADENQKTAASLNCWFVDKFCMNDCPLEGRRDVKISVIRLFLNKGKLDVEVYAPPNVGNQRSSDREQIATTASPTLQPEHPTENRISSDEGSLSAS